MVNDAGAEDGFGRDNDCGGVFDRCVTYTVFISKADDDSVVHTGAETDEVVAREIDVDGACAEGIGGKGNDFGGVGDWLISDGVGISKADSDGVLHNGEN